MVDPQLFELFNLEDLDFLIINRTIFPSFKAGNGTTNLLEIK